MAGTYQPQDDYTDGELALMDENGPWPRCTTCGWSPDWSDKPHAQFAAEDTCATPHQVRVDPADLAGNDERGSNYARAGADHAAISTPAEPSARRPGRPEIGEPVNVRLGGHLPQVDEFAASHGLTRAAAIRELVSRGLDF